MLKILKLSPALSSNNLGDEIIQKSIDEELSYIFEGNYCINISTHLPISFAWGRLISETNYKFVCGSNLLCSNLFHYFRQWDINLFSAKYIKDSILIGAGWQRYGKGPNLYTKSVYKKCLSNNYVHSVRDNFTLEKMKKMGFKNVINTGCPTTWKFTSDFVKTINTSKRESAIITITDYSKNHELDKQWIDLVIRSYSTVYLWPQGLKDYSYAEKLGILDRVILISPSLDSFDQKLNSELVDYIGTRLHAGIRALQKKVRTLILSIDNRAEEMKKDINLPVIKRDDIDGINYFINHDATFDIRINEENIKKWKEQFDGKIKL